MAHKERLSRIRRRIFLSAMLVIFSGTMFLVLRDALSRPFGLILGFICGIGIGVLIGYCTLLVRARQNMDDCGDERVIANMNKATRWAFTASFIAIAPLMLLALIFDLRGTQVLLGMEGVMFASYGISWWLIEQKQNREAIDYD